MGNYSFVLDAEGKQLSPTKEVKAWYMIRKNKAKLVSKYPMVIQLKRIIPKDLICEDAIRSDGRELDFSKAVIIATTNAGQTNAKKKRLGFGEDTSTTKTTDTLKQYFDIELLNRFEEILEFNEISKDTYKQILSDIYERESARINKEFPKVSLPLVLTDAELDEMTEKSYNRDFGARPAMRIIKEHIEDII